MLGDERKVRVGARRERRAGQRSDGRPELFGLGVLRAALLRRRTVVKCAATHEQSETEQEPHQRPNSQEERVEGQHDLRRPTKQN